MNLLTKTNLLKTACLIATAATLGACTIRVNDKPAEQKVVDPTANVTEVSVTDFKELSPDEQAMAKVTPDTFTAKGEINLNRSIKPGSTTSREIYRKGIRGIDRRIENIKLDSFAETNAALSVDIDVNFNGAYGKQTRTDSCYIDRSTQVRPDGSTIEVRGGKCQPIIASTISSSTSASTPLNPDLGLCRMAAGSSNASTIRRVGLAKVRDAASAVYALFVTRLVEGTVECQETQKFDSNNQPLPVTYKTIGQGRSFSAQIMTDSTDISRPFTGTLSSVLFTEKITLNADGSVVTLTRDEMVK